MKLSYDPSTHRRCIGCESVGGQYPLRLITVSEEMSPFPSHCPVLECGHVDYPLSVFRDMHPEWWWDDASRAEVRAARWIDDQKEKTDG